MTTTTTTTTTTLRLETKLNINILAQVKISHGGIMPGGPEGMGLSEKDLMIGDEESDERVHDVDTAHDRAIASNPHHTAAKEWREISTQEYQKADAVLTADGALRGGGQKARDDYKFLKDQSGFHSAVSVEESRKAEKIDDGKEV